MAKFFDRSMLFFLLIGAGNTLLSAGMMWVFYDNFHLGYWLSSAIAFALTSVLSFFLNKKLSFQNTDSLKSTAWRFALVIAVCYFLAYSVARPVTGALLAKFLPRVDLGLTEKISLFTGQIIYTGLNYLGQRFFAFKKK